MSIPSILQNGGFLGEVVESYPAPTLIVDDDVRALFINRVARQALGLETSDQIRQALLMRGGHLLHCVHADETPEGCGRAPSCKTCVVRNSVGSAFKSSDIHRARAVMQLQTPMKTIDAHFLVSAASVRHGDIHAAILTLEDISELVKLTSLLPICSCCHKVRNEQDYWTSVEDYFKAKADIDFSHALCAECLDKYYPAEEEAKPAGAQP